MLTPARVSIDDSIVVAIFTDGGSRTRLVIRNLGPDTVYIVEADAADETDGFPLLPSESLNLTPATKSDNVYGICATAETAEVAVLYG